MFTLSLPTLILFLTTLLGPLTKIQAQTPIPLQESSIITNEALVNFPQDVLFRLEMAEGMNIVEAELVYDVGRAGCIDVSTQVPVDVDGNLLEWEWAMVRSGNPPPGAELWWEWRLTDDQGQVHKTARQFLTFSDDRFEWQTIQDGDITLHWYEGEEVGPMLLSAAGSGLTILQEELGIELIEDVTIYIYGSPADMRDAVLSTQDWAGGVAFTNYNTILIGVQPEQAAGWGQSTIRHELAHLVSGQFGRNCVGGHHPLWLEEGMAMYAEGDPSDQVVEDLENGVRDNIFLPLRSMNNIFPAHGEGAGLAYSQSYSTVAYLRDEHGKENLQALLLTLADGQDYDGALEEIYGFNVDGLETAWRDWIGAPPRQIPPTPTPLSANAVPTIQPLPGPASLATTEAVQNQPPPEQDPTTNGICGLGLIPLALLGLLIFLGIRRYP